ncbi:hypothetical protein MD537_18590, partial [Flavihumibacter sediminis]|nr:hypothetical protein [Flavihumibacter sediminis]
MLENIQLNGRGSAKQTYHLELSLEGSGLQYQPGDTLGVWVENHSSLVEGLLAYKKFNPDTRLQIKDTDISLFEFLQKQAELTTVSGSFLAAYSAFVDDPAQAHQLNSILADKQALSSFVYGKDVWDVLQEFPSTLNEEQLAAILLPLQPRLYSIA